MEISVEYFNLKGHGPLWDRADLDGPGHSFAVLKSVYLNSKSQTSARRIYSSRNPLHSCLVFHLIFDILLKTCF